MKAFLQELTDLMNTHDAIEGHKLFRIYRDVRFSKDKTPYKPHFAASFKRAGAALRGGYYMRIRPGESFLAAGFWNPEKEDLWRIRKELEQDAGTFRALVEAPKFAGIWGAIQGEAVKTAPKGFDREHPDIDLIRHKQFIFVRKLKDKEVVSANFMAQINEHFKAIRPWFDLMSEILTTDLNGQSLLDERSLLK
jgi:uncharacterized protein (TIGR02453 family)